MLDLLSGMRNIILEVADRYGAYDIHVFGSAARGDADERSDIDLLVRMKQGRSLLDMGGMLMELQATLGRRVDVVTREGLRARIRDRVLKEAVPL